MENKHLLDKSAHYAVHHFAGRIGESYINSIEEFFKCERDSINSKFAKTLYELKVKGDHMTLTSIAENIEESAEAVSDVFKKMTELSFASFINTRVGNDVKLVPELSELGYKYIREAEFYKDVEA